jgi:hypothetical protein
VRRIVPSPFGVATSQVPVKVAATPAAAMKYNKMNGFIINRRAFRALYRLYAEQASSHLL